jgi:hypothetical protein
VYSSTKFSSILNHSDNAYYLASNPIDQGRPTEIPILVSTTTKFRIVQTFKYWFYKLVCIYKVCLFPAYLLFSGKFEVCYLKKKEKELGLAHLKNRKTQQIRQNIITLTGFFCEPPCSCFLKCLLYPSVAAERPVYPR